MLLDLKVKEGSKAREYRWPLEARKGKEMDTPQEPAEGLQTL